ncbi:MAG: ABC transporter ATP-binding protein [Desulfovibrionales bacterium]|nr:ABC transporter ATP-binding protein [Desulfovibrionales bacterium]
MCAAPLYELAGVGKDYDGPAERLTVINNLDLVIEQGEALAITGASGSGKSTLLHLLGTLDIPSRGDLFFNGRNLARLSDDEKAAVRNKDIGFVFQFHHLLPEFSTIENVAMQAIIGGVSKNEAFDRAAKMLSLVGLGQRIDHKVTTLSGGERQRAAIARAVLMEPSVLLADEPTGNLDERTGESVGDLLLKLNDELGMTLVVVTHNPELSDIMRRRLELRAGELYVQTV